MRGRARAAPACADAAGYGRQRLDFGPSGMGVSRVRGAKHPSRRPERRAADSARPRPRRRSEWSYSVRRRRLARNRSQRSHSIGRRLSSPAPERTLPGKYRPRSVCDGTADAPRVDSTSTGVAVCGGEIWVTGCSRCHSAPLCSFCSPASRNASTPTAHHDQYRQRQRMGPLSGAVPSPDRLHSWGTRSMPPALAACNPGHPVGPSSAFAISTTM